MVERFYSRGQSCVEHNESARREAGTHTSLSARARGARINFRFYSELPDPGADSLHSLSNCASVALPGDPNPHVIRRCAVAVYTVRCLVTGTRAALCRPHLLACPAPCIVSVGGTRA